VLITGGAGFIGSNLADRLVSMGRRVVILDNLSRAGVDQNALWLQRRHGRQVKIIVGDIRERADVQRALQEVDHVFHLAAQVAVTTSLIDPRTDFDVNVTGTMNILELMRESTSPPSLIYTSTNKVYGDLADVKLNRIGERYEPADQPIKRHGISEEQRLDFHTPYGCSKGAAEQYILDHARSLGLRGLVFRMSCIYGPHQFGTEDQGWVAHFLIRALEGKSITLYGDGMQVRDILFVDDLLDAFLRAWQDIDKLSGHAFNIGGGAERSLSLLELVRLIENLHGESVELNFDNCRPGDQRYYVSDITKFQDATGWQPKVTPRMGICRLHEWLLDSRHFAAQEIVAS
jgi:CDP-paratose 2-epimerase